MSVQDKLITLSPEEISNLYKKVFTSAEGQLVLQDLTNRFNPQVPAVPEDIAVDVYRLCINEGRRSVMFHISTQLLPEAE
jgi:hypothetical protein